VVRNKTNQRRAAKTAPIAAAAAAMGTLLGRAAPVGAVDGAEPDTEGLEDSGAEEDAGLVADGEETGAEDETGVLRVLVAVLVVVVLDVDVDTVLLTDTDLPLEVGELEALLLEPKPWQLLGPPPTTVNTAEFSGVPVESLMKSCSLWPTGSATSQVKDVFVNCPKLTRMSELSSPSTRVMK